MSTDATDPPADKTSPFVLICAAAALYALCACLAWLHDTVVTRKRERVACETILAVRGNRGAYPQVAALLDLHTADVVRSAGGGGAAMFRYRGGGMGGGIGGGWGGGGYDPYGAGLAGGPPGYEDDDGYGGY